MVITDFHTHTFPQKIAQRAIASLEKSSNTKAFLDGTTESLKASMKRAGIGRAVLLPIAVKPEQTPTINNVAIENNRDSCFASFGSVHPYYENYIEELEKIKKGGLRGIKLHPDFQGVFLDDPKMAEVMHAAAQMGLIITIHAGLDVSYPDVHKSTPERLYNILPGLKGAKIVCAHSGGFKYLDDFEKYLLGREEIYIDTSYSIGKMDTKQLERIYKEIDPGHILFGTDSPWDDQKKAIEEFLSLNISDEIKNKALYENAESLLR